MIQDHDLLSHYVFGCIDLPLGSSPELIIQKWFFPRFAQREAFRSNRILFQYSASSYPLPHDDYQAGILRCFPGLNFPRSMEAEIPEWRQEMLGACEAVEKGGMGSRPAYGDKPLDQQEILHGGALGLLYCRKVHDTVSREIIQFVNETKPLAERTDRIVLVSDLILLLLRNIAPKLSGEAHAKILREWIQFFPQTWSTPPRAEFVNPFHATFPALETHLHRVVAEGTPDVAWEKLKQNVQTKFRADPFLAKPCEVIESLTMPHMEWVCRRVLHYFFPRFMIQSEEEIIITHCLANLLEKGDF